MDTNINSQADETVMESYAKIPLDDVSRFLLVSNVSFPLVREPVSHLFQTLYPPSCKRSKHLPLFEEFKHPPQCLQMLYREDLLYLGYWFSNCTQMLFKVQYIITRLHQKQKILSPSGIEHATDVLCHNTLMALPTLLPV